MSRVLRFDNRIEEYLKREAEELKTLGIHPVSRPMALRYLIEKYNAGKMFERMKANRKKRNKKDIVINLK